MQFHPQFLIDFQFINMSSQEVSLEQGFVNQYDEGDMVEFTQLDEPLEVEEKKEDSQNPSHTTKTCFVTAYAQKKANPTYSPVLG